MRRAHTWHRSRGSAVILSILTTMLLSSCGSTPESPEPTESDPTTVTESDATSAPTETAKPGATVAEKTEPETPDTEPEPEPSPPPRTLDASRFAAVAIPADGTYRDLRVNDAAVPALHISDGGTRVRVEQTGFRGRHVFLDLSTDGNLPRGYFNSFRMDANGDGDLADELIRDGIWKMDEKGNLTRLDG